MVRPFPEGFTDLGDYYVSDQMENTDAAQDHPEMPCVPTEPRLEVYYLSQKKKGDEVMDDKLMGVVRHVITAVGAVAVYYGVMDESSLATWAGAGATFLAMFWSWMSKSEA